MSPNPSPVPARPRIVCLCGSTRFWRTFQEVGLAETLAGNIVLSIGAARCADGDDVTFGGYVPASDYDAVKQALDQLHLRKIDLADEVLILNVGGYVGSSTRSELAYAIAHGKPVRWLEPAPTPHNLTPETSNPPLVSPSYNHTSDERSFLALAGAAATLCALALLALAALGVI